jgi:two-component system response regulator
VSVALATLPDIVLMDMNLPLKDGWTAAREIRSDARGTHMGIIALTAHAMADDRERALAAGCDDYETKPLDFARLVSRIEALLVRSR